MASIKTKTEKKRKLNSNGYRDITQTVRMMRTGARNVAVNIDDKAS